MNARFFGNRFLEFFKIDKRTFKQNVSGGSEDCRDGAEGYHRPELYQQQALHSQQRRRAEALRQCGLAVQGKRSFGGWGPKGNQPGRYGYLEPVHVRKPHREAVPGAGEEVRAGDREYGDGDNGEGYQRTGTEEGAGADLGVSV